MEFCIAHILSLVWSRPPLPRTKPDWNSWEKFFLSQDSGTCGSLGGAGEVQTRCKPIIPPGLTGLLINYQRASTGAVHCLCFAKSPQRPASEGAKQGEEARCSNSFSIGFFSQFQFTAPGTHPLSFASLSFHLLSYSHNLFTIFPRNLLTIYSHNLFTIYSHNLLKA